MLRLSKHFVENWRERVGNEPSLDIVEMIIRDGVRIQQGKVFGKNKTLSYFWHPDLKLIVSIDRFSSTAVSVLSEANMSGNNLKVTRKRKNNEKKQGVMQAGYVAMTMHR